MARPEHTIKTCLSKARTSCLPYSIVTCRTNYRHSVMSVSLLCLSCGDIPSSCAACSCDHYCWQNPSGNSGGQHCHSHRRTCSGLRKGNKSVIFPSLPDPIFYRYYKFYYNLQKAKEKVCFGSSMPFTLQDLYNP